MNFRMTDAFVVEAKKRNPQLVKLCRGFVRIGGGVFEERKNPDYFFVSKSEDRSKHHNKCLDWEGFLGMIENLGMHNKKIGPEINSNITPTAKQSQQFKTPDTVVENRPALSIQRA